MLQLVHLYLITSLTVAAYAYARFRRGKERCTLRTLASELKMNYVSVDQFKLADRIVEAFPVPGAARLVVTDLVYALHGDHYRYVFTANYTIGAVKLRKRACRVAAYEEPAPGAKRDAAATHVASRIELAPVGMPWVEQYRTLATRVG